MEIYQSKTWTSDIEEVLQTLPELASLAGMSVLITGCTGLICSAVVDVLICWNERNDNKIRIIAAGRNLERIKDRFTPYFHNEWFKGVQYDATMADCSFDFSCDYIIHGASNASPNKIVKEPVETMLSNFVGVKSLLDYARESGIKRLVLISSSEVYGKKNNNLPHKTDEYGFIDILNSRNSYSVSKRAAETLCVSYSDEYGVDSVIVRPGHIYGPTARTADNRVSSVWPYNVAAGKDIIMKSEGKQMRSYCYCLDCASAILIAMLKGKRAEAYNVSNPQSIISIRQMAEMLVETAGVKLKMKLPDDDEKRAFNPMTNSSLDGTALLDLGWKPLFNAERGFQHTVDIIKEKKDWEVC